MDDEAVVFTEEAESVEVARAPVAEDEASSDGDAGNPAKSMDQALDESVGGLPAEREVEGEDEGGGDAEGMEGVKSAP